VTGRLVRIDDTALWVVERGAGYPVLVLHGGPGLDHHEFADYLDPLGEDLRLIFVDLRACGRSERPPEHTWTLERHAQDVIMLARALRLDRYAVLGHSYGAFVALQNAVDYPGMAAQTIVSSGVPSIRFLGPAVERSIESFEPASLRAQVKASWEREPNVRTEEEFARLLADQMPFHFADPQDPRIADYLERSNDTIYAPDVLRRSSSDGFGQIDLESRLSLVASPTLVLTGRWDRACTVEAAQATVAGIAGARLGVFEHSAHMAFVEENDAYLSSVHNFLAPVRWASCSSHSRCFCQPSERGVWTLVIVGLDEPRERSEPCSVGSIEPDVGPFVEHGAVEPLRLAVGLRAIRTGDLVRRSDLGERRLKVARDDVILGPIGHDALDPDPQTSKVRGRAQHEARAGGASLIRQRLDVGIARVIIDRHVQVVVSGAASLARFGLGGAPELLPTAAGTDPPELFDVDMDELTGAGAFIAHDDRGGPVIAGELRDPVTRQDPVDRRAGVAKIGT